jgi:hypothetical protein
MFEFGVLIKSSESLLYISLLSPLQSGLHSLQPTCTRMTSGHSLGTTAVNISLFFPLNYFLSLLPISPSFLFIITPSLSLPFVRLQRVYPQTFCSDLGLPEPEACSD